MKPIEAGCMALTHSTLLPENSGKIVKVIRYIGTLEDYRAPKRWEIDCVFKCIYGGTVNSLGEAMLMRIDDPDIQKQIESEREKVLVKL